MKHFNFIFLTCLASIFLTEICLATDRTQPASGDITKQPNSTLDNIMEIKRHLWVATTGHIADALRNLSQGVDVNITLLCQPGVDPHSYSASIKDVRDMNEATAIFYNGFHLEAKLHDILHHELSKKSWAMADAFPNEARLDWVEDREVNPNAPFDPHIWNHLPSWIICIKELTNRLCEIDKAHAEIYKKNGEAYVNSIALVHEYAIERFNTIPKEKRVIVSAHDAFNYFAKVYGFESLAILGVGNDAEADVKTMREVAGTVSKRKIPVIFFENMTNSKVTNALQEACRSKGWSVKISKAPLYSDDLGTNPPLNTFLGAFKYNVDLIADSLGK
ncbi:MAG: zinc ABC transporter substrate-binding protein [Endozoicomonas sp. (ex Botrylloides leachii)]|nr:zinc ABC transporter substrate-binding protein [Endozoicomonas sp. (ex Botrylloides leachii)]